MKPFVFVDLAGLTLSSNEISLLRDPMVAGLTLFARNFQDQQQLVSLTEHIKSIREDLLIAVDHEGGRVQRFRDGFTILPSMKNLVAQTAGDLTKIKEVAWLAGAELKAFHIDINYAPVLDIDRGLNTVIGDRAFHTDPAQVAKCAAAYAEGLLEAGILSVGKHFPGHGGVALDSHLAAPVDERLLSDIIASDVLPFQSLIDQKLLAGVMPSHVIYPDLDDKPAGFSRKWVVDILRNSCGYTGWVFSDDLSMKAAHFAGNMCQRVELSIASGCDIVLICNYTGNILQDLENIEVLPSGEGCIEPWLERINTVKPMTWEQLSQSQRWQQVHKEIIDART